MNIYSSYFKVYSPPPMQFYPAIGLSDRQAVRRTLICKFPAARFNRRFPGKTNLRGHAFGRADTVDDLSVLTFIGRAYLPANAVIFRAQARKSLARAGRNLYFSNPGAAASMPATRRYTNSMTDP